jgi:hypothetical protein
LSDFGALFAGVAAVGWIWDKYVEKRDRPTAEVDFRNNATVTRDGVSYDMLTLTNTGTDDAYLHQGLLVVNGGGLREFEGFERPTVLRIGESARLLYTGIRPGETYAVLTLRYPRKRDVVIQWDPIHNATGLGEELIRQIEDLRKRPPEWVAGKRPAQFVGPGGVAAIRLRSGTPIEEYSRRLAVALGEMPPPEPMPPSRPRRVLIWLWGRYALAKKFASRKSHPVEG